MSLPDTLPELPSTRPVLAAERWFAAAAELSGSMVDFLRRLIQTPGLPGAEADTARLVQDQMRRLGYDDVWQDAAGNVVGALRGGPGRSLMLNTHLDHVDVGDPGRWPLPPFAGTLRDGAIWGRGAMDIKGPLAAQVHAPALLAALGLQPAGDLYVTAVVMEEVGGVGARLLLESLRPELAVVGEASGCRLARGHRGRLELELRCRGRSAHASAPERGANPHFGLARFLGGLGDLALETDPELGAETVAPTLVRSDQASPNVIPGELTLTLDWRTVPAAGPESVLRRLEALAEATAGPGLESRVRLREACWRTYTGLERTLPSVAPAFRLPEEAPLVRSARAILGAALGRPVPAMLWRFATDGGHFAAAGVETLGFGPGDERLAHTVEERLDLDELDRGLVGFAALAARLGERDA